MGLGCDLGCLGLNLSQDLGTELEARIATEFVLVAGSFVLSESLLFICLYKVVHA